MQPFVLGVALRVKRNLVVSIIVIGDENDCYNCSLNKYVSVRRTDIFDN